MSRGVVVASVSWIVPARIERMAEGNGRSHVAGT